MGPQPVKIMPAFMLALLLTVAQRAILNKKIKRIALKSIHPPAYRRTRNNEPGGDRRPPQSSTAEVRLPAHL